MVIGAGQRHDGFRTLAYQIRHGLQTPDGDWIVLQLFGDYREFINLVPTTFNKVMDIFLTHVTSVDGIEILHKFTCLELKADRATERRCRRRHLSIAGRPSNDGRA